jgi:hypothetical protein
LTPFNKIDPTVEGASCFGINAATTAPSKFFDGELSGLVIVQSMNIVETPLYETAGSSGRFFKTPIERLNGEYRIEN